MGNQNAACCGSSSNGNVIVNAAAGPSKSLYYKNKMFVETKTKLRKNQDPNIFEENKKSQFMNLSQYDLNFTNDWDDKLNEDEREEILLARSELQQAEHCTALYRQQSQNGQSQNVKDGQSGKISKDDFFIMKVIGRGGFGKVYMVKKRSNRKVYAMKVLSKDQIASRNMSVKT